MKKVLLTAVTLIAMQVSAQEKFTLSGTIKKNSVGIPNKVYLSYRMNGNLIKDSAEVVKNKYSFTGQIEEAVLAYVSAGIKNVEFRQKRDVAPIYLAPAKISVSHVDSFSHVKVKGSKAHDDYTALNDKMKPFNAEMESLSNEYRALAAKKDKEGMNKLEEKFDAIDLKQREVYKNEFLANPASPISVMMLDRYAGYDINADDVEPLYQKLPEAAKATPSGKAFGEKLNVAKVTGIGKMAPEFIQNDTLGNPVALSSFRGKYLLVDFWASWCGPCRRENPNVVKAFTKYKDRGFYILGVSLDQPNAKEKWMKAIHDDQLTWSHVSDLQYWKNAVAVQYGVQAIPQNYLIDPNGKIIAKNLRGEALDKKLDELMK